MRPHISTENNTTRRFPRTRREAFREWPESALGINDPVIQTDTSITARVIRVLMKTWRQVLKEWM